MATKCQFTVVLPFTKKKISLATALYSLPVGSLCGACFIRRGVYLAQILYEKLKTLL